MDEPWRIEDSRNEMIVSKREKWTINDKKTDPMALTSTHNLLANDP